MEIATRGDELVMGIDGGLMLVAALICVLAVPLLLITAVYVGARVARSGRWVGAQPEGRDVLDRRLAAGEIGVDEYYERESALRSANAGSSPRRGRR